MKKTSMAVAMIMVFIITLGSANATAFPSFFEKDFSHFSFFNPVLNLKPDPNPEAQGFFEFVINHISSAVMIKEIQEVKNDEMIKNDYIDNYMFFHEKDPIITTQDFRYEINLWNDPDLSIYGSPLSKKQHLKSNGFLILDRSRLGNPRYLEIEVKRPPWITDHIAVYKDAVTINGVHAKSFDTDGHQIKKGYWIRPGSTFGKWYFDMSDMCGDTLYIDFSLLTATTYDGIGVDTDVFADIKILGNPRSSEPVKNCEPSRHPRCYIRCVKTNDGRIVDEMTYISNCEDVTEKILENESMSTQEPKQKLSPEEMRKIQILSAHDSPAPPTPLPVV